MTHEVAIVGAGYVGVPLAQVFAEAGVGALLVDVDSDRVAALNRGESYIEDVPSEELARLVESGAIAATTDYDSLRDANAILTAPRTIERSGSRLTDSGVGSAIRIALASPRLS